MNVTILSGGVGGARLARGFAGQVDVETTVVVNVGDDVRVYGLDVSPDLDTVVYTLAETESDRGWGIKEDTFTVLEYLRSFGVDTTFAIGDLDLATNLFRTDMLAQGARLSEITRRVAESFGVQARILPVTDDPVRTVLQTVDGTWISFQEYFVHRGHRDAIKDVRFDGAATAGPAPDVIESIEGADLVVVGPSNPPLSIWPILAVPGVGDAVAGARRVVGVSPLFGGRAVKGPTAEVLADLSLGEGNEAVLRAYPNLLSDFVIDVGDAPDRTKLIGHGVRVHVLDTRIAESAQARRFASHLLDLL